MDDRSGPVAESALQCRGHPFGPWSRKAPLTWSISAQVPELLSLCLQLPRLACHSDCALRQEASALQLSRLPVAATRESLAQQQRPGATKNSQINTIIFKK